MKKFKRVKFIDVQPMQRFYAWGCEYIKINEEKAESCATGVHYQLNDIDRVDIEDLE